ncbi:hypothetical protein NP493_673g02004 [Ridgeia piscesae]|uniref:Uncharacterized protein n=1 Tax=Ridgeia piscesae TaxID=27915 RepID=A0AAD9KS38_RIDPI|nr:hypothetical protein NP493_673g02004 [Ridgeia piscesae]
MSNMASITSPIFLRLLTAWFLLAAACLITIFISASSKPSSFSASSPIAWNMALFVATCTIVSAVTCLPWRISFRRSSGMRMLCEITPIMVTPDQSDWRVISYFFLFALTLIHNHGRPVSSSGKSAQVLVFSESNFLSTTCVSEVLVMHGHSEWMQLLLTFTDEA